MPSIGKAHVAAELYSAGESVNCHKYFENSFIFSQVRHKLPLIYQFYSGVITKVENICPEKAFICDRRSDSIQNDKKKVKKI